ncbi:MAG: hypothetical protein ABSA52_08215 [Candidatus Binatia bacterium]|jgi:hypothetical protein
MKKASKYCEPSAESLRAFPEVDFSQLQRGRRGKYAHLLTGEAVRAVVIDQDVWEHFGSARAVNSALRMLVHLATKARGKNVPKGRARHAA